MVLGIWLKRWFKTEGLEAVSLWNWDVCQKWSSLRPDLLAYVSGRRFGFVWLLLGLMLGGWIGIDAIRVSVAKDVFLDVVTVCLAR